MGVVSPLEFAEGDLVITDGLLIGLQEDDQLINATGILMTSYSSALELGWC